MGQVFDWPPEPPLISVTKASLFRILYRYLVDILFFLTSLRIRNEHVYDAFTIQKKVVTILSIYNKCIFPQHLQLKS